MSEKRVGLVARIRLVSGDAMAGMRRVSRGFVGMGAAAARARRGIASVKTGMTQLSVVGVATAAATSFAIKKYADFEGAMGAVTAVLLVSDKANKQYIPRLTALATELGASTSFTATQAANAMENLARAGFEPTQIMKGIRPVLAAAAAEGMSLATAADIVASNLRAFRLPALEAARVADVLSFVSAKTNTNMVQLQEGMKFAAPVARGLGISIEQTVASLGLLADVGLKGSVGGTALKNALIKIGRATKDGFVKIGQFRVAVAKTRDGSVHLSKTLFAVSSALQNISDPIKRQNAAIKLLGLRGFGAASGFAALNSKSKKAKELFENIGKLSKGAAQKMSDIRLDNLHGAFVLLSSAADGLMQSFAKTFRGGLAAHIKTITSVMNQASAAFAYFASQPGALDKKGVPAIKNVSTKITKAVKGVILGVRGVLAGFKDIISGVKSAFGWFSKFTGGGVEGTAKFITKLLGVTVAVAGISVVVVALTTVFGGLAAVIGGIGTLAFGASGMAAIGGVGGGKGLIGVLGRIGPLFSRMSAGLVPTVARLPLLGGALTSSVSKANLFAGGLAKASLKVLGMAAAVTAAGLAGWKFGKWLDKRFNLSGKLSDLGMAADAGLSKLLGIDALRAKDERRRLASGAIGDKLSNFERVQSAASARGGIGSIALRGDPSKRHKLTREFVRQRVTMMLSKGGLGSIAQLKATAQQGGVEGQSALSLLTQINEALQKFPTSKDFKPIIKVDGRVLATTVTKADKEAKDRGAQTRRRATQ